MIQVLVLFTVLLIVYLALRSQGFVEGLTIRIKVPSYSTPEGQRARIKLIMMLTLLLAAIIFVLVSDANTNNKGLVYVIIFSIITGVSVKVFHRKK